jgi:hypothetical protein
MVMWNLLPFGLVVVLGAGMLLASSALGNKFSPGFKEQPGRGETEKKCLAPTLAFVDQHGGVRYLSREEFDLLKLNPKFVEMKACGMVYLTEVPEIKELPRPAGPQAGPLKLEDRR